MNLIPTFVLALAFTLPAQAASQISVDSLSADGMEVRQLSCALDHGGLLGPIIVVSAVATGKTALDACDPKGAAFRATWTWSGGKTAEVKVVEASDAAGAACIEKALGAVVPTLTGTCSAVLLVGETVAAESAIIALQPVPGQ